MALLGMAPAMAQEFGYDGLSKSEYRYWNFVLGINHGFGSAFGGGYDKYMLHKVGDGVMSSDMSSYEATYHPSGDMFKETKGFTYTPGYQVGFVYNYDLLNNHSGIVAGVEFSNYGFTNNYKSTISNENVKETFRSMAVTVPILFKFGPSDIYSDMQYICVGVKANMNLAVMRGQKASWANEKYGEKLANGKSALSCAATVGFNTGMLSVNVNYMFMEFVDAKFADTDGNTPFQGIKGHVYLCTSLNVPMTRWLSIHNWTAEKIRRKLHGGNGM